MYEDDDKPTEWEKFKAWFIDWCMNGWLIVAIWVLILMIIGILDATGLFP